ncbi:MAG: type IX secretion system membrane protein PorP/SprF [Cyclobacteriaceae bacterium]|nr:type IX secretion system membrane protein PorP/SprF [Cyclobacteriaceae bacterium HetDA_MAG_MS6]
MRLVRLSVTALAILCFSQAFGQQRIATSTYAFNGLLLNPAYAGSLNVLSVTAVHREQWVNVDGAPKNQSLTAHTSLMNNRVGVGFMAVRNQLGVNDDVSVYGSYAYKIRTSIGIISMGLQGGFDNRKSDFSQLTLLDPGDPFLSGQTSRFNPNFGTGVYFANPNFFFGVSVPYILENKTIVVDEVAESVQDTRQSRYYYMTSGMVLHLSHAIKLNPSVLLRMQEEARVGWDINANIIFDEIAYAGVSVRNSGDIVFLGQLILNENLRVGYAYDATTSSLGNTSRGSHEILVNYRIKLRNYKKDPQCPVYF